MPLSVRMHSPCASPPADGAPGAHFILSNAYQMDSDYLDVNHGIKLERPKEIS